MMLPCVPNPELEPLELLARDVVPGQRGGPILKVDSFQGPQLAPDGDAVARRFARKLVEQDRPPRLGRLAYSNGHTIPAAAPTGTMR